MFFSKSLRREIASLRAQLADVELEKDLLKIGTTLAITREKRIKDLLNRSSRIETIARTGVTAEGAEYLISSFYTKFDKEIEIEVYSLDGDDIDEIDFMITAFKRADRTIHITGFGGDFKFGSEAIKWLAFLAKRDTVSQIIHEFTLKTLPEFEKLNEAYVKNGFQVRFNREQWTGTATKTFSTSVLN